MDLVIAILTSVAMISFTAFSLRFLKTHHQDMPLYSFKIKYDSLYQNLDYYKAKALPHTFYFLGRRLAFAAVIAFCSSSIVL